MNKNKTKEARVYSQEVKHKESEATTQQSNSADLLEEKRNNEKTKEQKGVSKRHNRGGTRNENDAEQTRRYFIRGRTTSDWGKERHPKAESKKTVAGIPRVKRQNGKERNQQPTTMCTRNSQGKGGNKSNNEASIKQ